MATLVEQLDAMRDLNENWDGYGAAAPEGRVLDLAREFVRLIEAVLRRRGAAADNLYVSPTRIGGVLIEWEDGEMEHEVEINPDQSFSFLHLNKTPILNYVTIAVKPVFLSHACTSPVQSGC